MYRSIFIALLSFTAAEKAYARTQTSTVSQNSLKDIKDVASYREIAKRRSPVVIVFTSPSCGVCGPHKEALAVVAKRHGVEAYEFDVSNLPDLRTELGIKYYPTTHFIPNGKKIDTSMDEARFEAEIYELKHGKKKEEVQAPAPRPVASPAQRRNIKRPGQ